MIALVEYQFNTLNVCFENIDRVRIIKHSKVNIDLFFEPEILRRVKSVAAGAGEPPSIPINLTLLSLNCFIDFILLAYMINFQ